LKRDVAWARSEPACFAREAILGGFCQPVISLYSRRTIGGLENLQGIDGPVVFVANHCSHIDTPLILRALPWRWRRRTAVAAAADYFYERRLLANVVSLAFSTVPVERNGDRVRPDAVSGLDQLLNSGWSIAIFAEGTRSRDGTVGALQSGAAVLASQHNLPMVPVYVSGTHATMPAGARWMRRRPDGRRQEARIVFGAPIAPRPVSERREAMEQVRLFFEAQGATTTPNKRLAAKRALATTAA
jgi:1-acyl-sn-glycerol-3-phosphate acyltransferase